MFSYQNDLFVWDCSEGSNKNEMLQDIPDIVNTCKTYSDSHRSINLIFSSKVASDDKYSLRSQLLIAMNDQGLSNVNFIDLFNSSTKKKIAPNVLSEIIALGRVNSNYLEKYAGNVLLNIDSYEEKINERFIKYLLNYRHGITDIRVIGNERLALGIYNNKRVMLVPVCQGVSYAPKFTQEIKDYEYIDLRLSRDYPVRVYLCDRMLANSIDYQSHQQARDKIVFKFDSIDIKLTYDSIPYEPASRKIFEENSVEDSGEYLFLLPSRKALSRMHRNDKNMRNINEYATEFGVHYEDGHLTIRRNLYDDEVVHLPSKYWDDVSCAYTYSFLNRGKYRLRIDLSKYQEVDVDIGVNGGSDYNIIYVPKLLMVHKDRLRNAVNSTKDKNWIQDDHGYMMEINCYNDWENKSNFDTEKKREQHRQVNFKLSQPNTNNGVQFRINKVA